jgi:hypothetical protein
VIVVMVVMVVMVVIGVVGVIPAKAGISSTHPRIHLSTKPFQPFQVSKVSEVTATSHKKPLKILLL